MNSGQAILVPGLCSVTFRRRRVHNIISDAAAAGLVGIEWGADSHVPPGAVAAARTVRAKTVDAGLRVASYGSYYRADGAESFAAALASATALGAPRIRVWAGSTASTEISDEQRSQVTAALRSAAAQAAAEGIQVALEFHGGTLTDTPASTLRLLDEVGHPNLLTYWQPPIAAADAEAIASLEAVLDRVAAVHVFSWWPSTERRRLAERATLWETVFTTLRDRKGGFDRVDALLEFLPDDDSSLLSDEATALGRLISRPDCDQT